MPNSVTNKLGRFRAGRAISILPLILIMDLALAGENSITSPDAEGDVGRFTTLALDKAGNPVIGYHDLDKRKLKLLHCDDSACTGSEKRNIAIADAGKMVGTYNALILDAAGLPVISYYDSFSGSLRVLHCDDSKCDGDESSHIAIPDPANMVGMYTSLKLDAGGNPVVSYYDVSNGDLKLLHCDDPNCSGDETANISTPDSAGDVGLYTSLALDADGNPVLSYADSSNGNLKLLHCDDPYCRGDESVNIVIADSGNVGWYSSLVLDAAGHPVVAYQDFEKAQLKLMRCSDRNCRGDLSASIANLDKAGTVGGYISLVLDAGGHPVISYYDSANGNLKLLHCDDPGCAGDEFSNITALDVEGDVGLYTSLVLDASGNPVISYYDFSNRDLKLLRCVDPFCDSKHANRPGP